MVFVISLGIDVTEILSSDCIVTDGVDDIVHELVHSSSLFRFPSSHSSVSDMSQSQQYNGILRFLDHHDPQSHHTDVQTKVVLMLVS